jgi:hypothetical protein
VRFGEALRSRRALLCATAAALMVAWLLPGRPVPIYDGIGAPDEPYRYVSVSPGVASRTQPPTTARITVPMQNGVASVVQLATAEQGPQAEVDIVGQSLSEPAASVSASVTVTLTPVAPDAGASGPQIDGNVYRLSWIAGSTAMSFSNQGDDLMYLRATVGPPPRATFVYRQGPGARWRALATDLAGADVYSALIQGAGDYALTRRPFVGAPVSSATHSAGAKSLPWTLVVVAALVLSMIGCVIIIRLLRGRDLR